MLVLDLCVNVCMRRLNAISTPRVWQKADMHRTCRPEPTYAPQIQFMSCTCTSTLLHYQRKLWNPSARHNRRVLMQKGGIA